jgi:hypothetical protein
VKKTPRINVRGDRLQDHWPPFARASNCGGSHAVWRCGEHPRPRWRGFLWRVSVLERAGWTLGPPTFELRKAGAATAGGNSPSKRSPSQVLRPRHAWRRREVRRQHGYQSNGAFPVGSRQTLAGVHQAARKPIDPQPAVRVEHYLNDCSIVQKARNAARWRTFTTECRKGGINPRLPAPTLLYRESWCRCVRPDQLSRGLQREPHRRERRRCWNHLTEAEFSERGWRSVSFRELSA